MKNILITRIDDRLIHGQVVTSWIKVFPINKILIIDDELSQNQFMGSVFRAAAPSGVEVSIRSLTDASELLLSKPLDGENFMILVRTPLVLEDLVSNGIKINKIILGGIGAKTGSKTLYRWISVSDEERKSLRRLINRKIEVVIQITAEDKPVDIEKYL